MDRTSLFLAGALTLLTTATSGAEPTDAQLEDWTIFLRSISLPVTSEVCGPLLGDAANYAAIAGIWLAANGDQILRGREFAKTGTPEGRDFNQLYADMAADFRKKLLAKPDDVRRALCKESLETLKKSVRPATGS
jgi:hypothetical protein